MTEEEMKALPVVLKAKEARDVLRIPSDEVWSAIVAANPQIKLEIPGSKRPRYRKAEVLRLLAPVAKP